MTFEIGQSRFQPAVQPPAPGPVAKTEPPAPVVPPPIDRLDVIPVVPPPEVLDEVALARERVGELAKEHRELHFAKDPASGRVIIQVRTLDGDVVRTIPPSKALAVMGGEQL